MVAHFLPDCFGVDFYGVFCLAEEEFNWEDERLFADEGFPVTDTEVL